MKNFENLSQEDRNLLLKAPVYVSILAAGNNHDLGDAQKADAIQLAHLKTFTSNSILSNYYKEVDKTFKNNFDHIISEFLPINEEKRKIIMLKLDEINKIISKLDTNFGIELHKSLSDYSEHVKKSNHSVLEDFIFPIPVHGITER